MVIFQCRMSPCSFHSLAGIILQEGGFFHLIFGSLVLFIYFVRYCFKTHEFKHI